MNTAHTSEVKYASRISINTLGVCSIAVDGIVQATVPSSYFRIAVHLLLSGSRMTISRQHLKSIFWPEADIENASANLRQNLARIRRFQGMNRFQLIQSNFSLLYLTPEGIDWDLLGFLDAIEGDDAASIVNACEFYGGDLLADIGASSPEFEEWLSEQRECLRRSMIERLTSALDGGATLSSAVRSLCARRLLTIDPCNERAYQAQMTEAAEQGDHARLHYLFERCERQLMSEFGVGSSDDTRALYSRLSQSLNSHLPQEDSH